MPAIVSKLVHGLHIAVFCLQSIVLLLFYSIKYIPQAGRPRPTWTFKQSLMNIVGRIYVRVLSITQPWTSLDFSPGNLKDRLITIAPGDPSKYVGVLSSKPDIKPEPIPAVWYPNNPTTTTSSSSSSSTRQKKVVLQFHGGGFVFFDSRPIDMGLAAETLSAHIAPQVLMISYRLATHKNGSFPAAIQDALSAYLNLISSGVDARGIVLSGDSAGANIVLGLLRYLNSKEAKDAFASDSKKITTPGGAILWSPWIDIAGVRNDPDRVYRHRNAASDYLTGECLEHGAKLIGTEEDVRSPYLTSLGHPFACPETPIFYQIGGAEILVDEQSQSALEMASVSGNKVGSWTEEDANHDILKGNTMMGFGEHIERCAKKAAAFLAEHGQES